MTSKQIIKHFDLKRPIYYQTAKYGHFGIVNNAHPWENTDKTDVFKKAFLNPHVEMQKV